MFLNALDHNCVVIINHIKITRQPSTLLEQWLYQTPLGYNNRLCSFHTNYFFIFLFSFYNKLREYIKNNTCFQEFIIKQIGEFEL